MLSDGTTISTAPLASRAPGRLRSPRPAARRRCRAARTWSSRRARRSRAPGRCCRGDATNCAAPGFVAAALALAVLPRGEVVPARAARRLRIRRDDADAGLDQVAPVLDALRVALSHEEHDRRGVGRAVLRQALLPAGVHEAALLDGVDVVGERERGDIGIEAVDDRPRLGAGSAVRLLHRHGLPGLLAPVLGERRVELGVQLARGIVGHIQQLDRRRGRRIRAPFSGAEPPHAAMSTRAQRSDDAEIERGTDVMSPQKATCARNTMASSGSRSGTRPPSNVVCSKVA